MQNLNTGKYSLRRYVLYLIRTSSNVWTNEITKEEYNIFDIINKFEYSLPKYIQEAIYSAIYNSVPDYLLSILNSINCKFIETGRLFSKNEINAESKYELEDTTNYLSISRKSKLIKNIISNYLNKYSERSQQTDATFPFRAMESIDKRQIGDIRDGLIRVKILRNDFVNLGIFRNEYSKSEDIESDIFQEQDETAFRIIAVYIDDNIRKLEFLAPIAERMKMFLSLTEDRFINKYISVDFENGLKVFNKNQKEIPVEKLSSGEQHQLLLIFKLIFETSKNSLILIDEPELSLHVYWQKRFMDDLMDIIQLNSFDVMLATHSPKIVGHWQHLSVEMS